MSMLTAYEDVNPDLCDQLLRLLRPGLQVHGHLERQGKRVDGITISGCWDGQLVAGYADGTRKLLWKANPSYLPNAM